MRAEEVYADPSALVRLYVHQDGSREMSAWRARQPGTMAVTHHGRIEIINAICRAAFRRQLDLNGLAEALVDFDSDFVLGHYQQADILWRAALNLAADLSQRHTPKLDTRSLDVLHVACALELKFRLFLSFDTSQQRLAVATGLRLVRL